MKKNVGKIMTVRGLIEPEELGKTLTHEHTLTYMPHYARPSEDPELALEFKKTITLDNLSALLADMYIIEENCINQDKDLIIKELKRYKKAGGGAIIDVTAGDLHTKDRGRTDTHWRTVQEISEQSDVHVICCAGDFVATSSDKRTEESTVDQLAQYYINTVNNGYGTSGVKPGHLGEIGTSNDLTPMEEKVLRAIAITSAETGLSMNIHIDINAWKNDFRILEILKEAGADLNRVVFSHREAALISPNWTIEDSIGHCMAIMDRGAHIELDGCGNQTNEIMPYGSWINPSDNDRAKLLYKLVIRGYSKRLLVSMDSAEKHRFTSYGGYAYTHILKGFHDTCQIVGIPEQYFLDFVLNNPRELLTIK